MAEGLAEVFGEKVCAQGGPQAIKAVPKGVGGGEKSIGVALAGDQNVGLGVRITGRYNHFFQFFEPKTCFRAYFGDACYNILIISRRNNFVD